jgi:hypothetical protein
MVHPKISFLVTGGCGDAESIVDCGGEAAVVDVFEIISI